MNQVHLCDCMEFMKGVPDKFYELAIVDPPYGIERFQHGSLRFDKSEKAKDGLLWDKKPSIEFFEELFRISNNQIIWGANNFQLPPTEYFCIWDKQQTVDNFASAEYAWVSMGMKKPAKVFRYSIHKHNQSDKIHPTQKPVALYKWLLKNYAKPNDKIFDSHVGSGSIRIACHDMGFDFDGCEIDKDYWEAQEERYLTHISQGDLFTGSDLQENIMQEQLFR